jgi:SAM-dependent methyltransferase
VQLLDVVNPNVLFRDYIYTTSVSLGLVQHFQNYADEMVRRFAGAPGLLAVDIGSNDGTLLKFFKRQGLRVLGIDPAVRIAQQAAAAGVETIPAFFTAQLAKELRAKHGAAALLTANNVFAHSDNLPNIADGVHELLADDGVFIFEVSYLVDIIEKMLFDTVYHEHLCYHSIKPFVSFFRRHNLELFDVQRLPTKGGSIRGFVQKSGGPRKAVPVVAELLALEARMGLDRLEIFQNYTVRLDSVKHELHTLLKRLKNEGETVAGYGASATVTTLLYNFELGGFLDFLVDDNVSRHGLFSPGYHIPVFAPAALMEKKADYCVVLAWQYADPILKKNRAYSECGGRFILPMPEVRIV